MDAQVHPRLVAGRSNPARWRVVLLVLGGVCLLMGLNAALLLLGVPAPVESETLSNNHGLIMTLGFMGTVIALERAQALHQPWAYLAPGLLGSGGLALGFGASWLGHTLLLEGTLALLLVYALLFKRAPLPLVAVQGLSAVWAFIAAALALTLPTADLIVPLAAFIVLTIAAERAELAQLAMGPKAIPTLVLLSALLSAGVAAHLLWAYKGAHLYGVAQAIIAMWLLRDDVVRIFIRARGLRRYNASALLSGYTWLTLAGLIWAAGGGHIGTASYDAVIHCTFLGFGVSMIMAHAPIIFPTVIGRPLPYTPWFYLPLAALHGGMVLRIAGDFSGQGIAWQIGGSITVIAMLIFVILAAMTVLFNRRDQQQPQTPQTCEKKVQQ
ncbi:hypothetical protein CPTB_00424 [Corynebacterium pseudotuberculosis]|nr:Hypothetical protein Cp3995_0568 [Corynebacterium pseudotuberculosis 3/99-5]AIG06938.1 hypothetical protein CPTA_01109 [Corynebacterium pseudotuberculosis]AIG08480.1 hypothetical protein CPTB_00424 [Corynebacterium pseudotuberculosis]AIG10371.1 hypothetical protein CPTC_00083 [Corynebacterium pseudotuberculosis]AKC73314.1 Hypothetical protein Cp226_0577 [Corynebacterium pseudotuberculosis]